ncbi:hypothetical protein FRC03_011445 [Tulasnella sp. 419]|nr:hypothetical protein FRC03_011445 [Tulasnella sp. 419]
MASNPASSPTTDENQVVHSPSNDPVDEESRTTTGSSNVIDADNEKISHEIPAKEREGNPGGHWKDNEVHTIPYNNLKIIFPGMMLTIFLAALDQTISK